MPLRFDLRMYSRRAVEAAVAAYQDAAKFKLRETDRGLEVLIRPRPGVAEGELEGELANYALSEMAK